jgi:hypothetical protein
LYVFYDGRLEFVYGSVGHCTALLLRSKDRMCRDLPTLFSGAEELQINAMHSNLTLSPYTLCLKICCITRLYRVQSKPWI